MKTLNLFLKKMVTESVSFLFLLISLSVSGHPVQDNTDFITIRGKVIDHISRAPVNFAAVTVSGSNVATVTNIEGDFTLTVEKSLLKENVEISHIGYKNKTIEVASFGDKGKKMFILLESAPIPLKEIIVKPLDPEYIIDNCMRRINRNYETVPNLMTGFYRETIRKNRTYKSIGEAVVEIYKASYLNSFKNDAAKIYKGRKNVDHNGKDTLLFKLQGGPVSTLALDVIKNPGSFFMRESMNQYDYSLSSVIEIDGKPHYVISFAPKSHIDEPLFYGLLYIEVNSYALTEMEFSLNLSNISAATAIFIKRRPAGVSVVPKATKYRVMYHEQEGKWHFSYARAEVVFKVDWKKKLFNSSYTVMSELAVTDRTDREVIKIEGKDKFKYSDVFSEKVTAFADKDFWGYNNVIEPDQSIEAAIRKIGRKVKFSDRKK